MEAIIHPVITFSGASLSGKSVEKITRTIAVPLYYTGISKQAGITQNGKTVLYTPDRQYNIQVTITLEPERYTWFTIAGK